MGAVILVVYLKMHVVAVLNLGSNAGANIFFSFFVTLQFPKR